MELNTDDQIIIAVPLEHSLNSHLSNKRAVTSIDFDGGNIYNIFKCKIVSSANNTQVQQGSMTYADLRHAFSNTGKYGCYVRCTTPGDWETRSSRCEDNTTNEKTILPSIDFLLTWKQVLEGQHKGIQVWKDGTAKPYRDMYLVLRQKRKTDDGLKKTFYFLRNEIYGDRVQLAHLLGCYYRVLSESSTAKKNELQLKMYEYRAPTVLYGSDFNELLNYIDNKFKDAIESSFFQFNSIKKPLLSNNDINDIIRMYETKLPNHISVMNKMLRFDKKSNETRNYHLTLSSFYKRRLLHAFMSQARIVNNHNLIHFAIVSAAATYGRGISSVQLLHCTHAGISSSIKTMLTKIKPYNMNAPSKIQNALKNHTSIVAMMDNNQKGNNMKFQRNGRSNKFITITGRSFRHCNLFNTSELDIDEDAIDKCKVPITYINQKIPSMFDMPGFEVVNRNNLAMESTVLTSSDMKDTIFLSSTVEKIDFTGERVERYSELVTVSNDTDFVFRKVLTNYNSLDGYKTWIHAPSEFTNQFRTDLSMTLSSVKASLLNEVVMFQHRALNAMDKNRNEPSRLLVPSVSKRDEVSTSGFGMAIVELLVMISVLKEVKTSNDNDIEVTQWELGDDYLKKQLYLCIDGLSLDRHRSFKKRLRMIPQSYSRNFQQAIIFQKALKRIVEIPGTLHISFHMLQSIFDLFRPLIKWILNVVRWKKAKINHVSDSFQICRDLSFLALEECERYLMDVMLTIELSEGERRQLMEDTNKIPSILSRMFNKFLSGAPSWSRNNNARKMILNFVQMTRKFRSYWNAVRCGDRIIQEKIFIEWLGIFVLAGKSNYFEICLNSIEKEYGEVSYKELQEIRINSYVNYENKNDGKSCHFVGLDEAQEMLNYWTKLLPVTGDVDNWIFHSGNLMFARQAINYENEQYMRQQLEYTNSADGEVLPSKKKRSKNNYRTTSPRAFLEKIRLYEFFVLLCHTDRYNHGIEMKYNDGIDIETKLTTSFQSNSDEDSNTDGKDSDNLHDCFTNIFHVDSLEDKDADMEESINNSDDLNDATPDTGKAFPFHTLVSSEDIFQEAATKLEQKNILKVRQSKKLRLERDESFFYEVNDKVHLLSLSIRNDIELAKKSANLLNQQNLGFRTRYQQLSN